MKQMIPFVKDISLGTKISEITSISLEHNLKMENSDSVVGTFIISGKYKMNEISINEESFNEEINFDITLDDKYDVSKVIIDIDDFYYEIINDEYLRIHIDVKVDNLNYLKEERISLEEEKEEELTEILVNKEEDLKMEKSVISENDNLKEERKESLNLAGTITSSFLNSEEKYITYKVHIIREDENIDTIINNYDVKKEELEKYNDLENIVMGSKIIIPIDNEQ